jgi:transposase
VPELERLARTIARWETPILRWHNTRLTNATTEGINLVIKNIKRLGFGFRNFDNYRRTMGRDLSPSSVPGPARGCGHRGRAGVAD